MIDTSPGMPDGVYDLLSGTRANPACRCVLVSSFRKSQLLRAGRLLCGTLLEEMNTAPNCAPRDHPCTSARPSPRRVSRCDKLALFGTLSINQYLFQQSDLVVVSFVAQRLWRKQRDNVTTNTRLWTPQRAPLPVPDCCERASGALL
jgi:hypothetical protein